MARAPQASCGYCEQKIQPETSFCSSCGYPTPWATTEDRTRWEVSQWQRYSEKSSESRTAQAPKLVSVRPEIVAAAQPRPVEEALRVQTRPVPVVNGKPTVKPVPKAARPAASEPLRRPVLEPVRPVQELELELEVEPELEVESIEPELELEIEPQIERDSGEPELELEVERVLEATPEPGHEPAASLSEVTGAVGKLRTLFQRLQGESGGPRPVENGSVSSEEKGHAAAAPAPWAVPQPVARPVSPQPVAQPPRTVRRVTPAPPRPVEPQRPKTTQGQTASRSRDAAKAEPVSRPPRQRRDPNEKLLSDTVQVLRQLSATMNEMAGALRVAQENQRRSIFRRNH